MSNIKIFNIDAYGPELDTAALLFDHYRSFYGCPSNLGLAKNYLRQRLEAKESDVLLAQKGGLWVGFCQLYRGLSSISCTHSVILNDLYVAEGQRSNGVGRILIEYTVKLARQRGASSVILETALTNERAQSIYERLGFKRQQGFVAYAMCLNSLGSKCL